MCVSYKSDGGPVLGKVVVPRRFAHSPSPSAPITPRERLVGQRTSVVNQIRAFLLERGVAVRQGLRFLRTELPIILARSRDCGCRTTDTQQDLVLGFGQTIRRAFARLVQHDLDLGGREAGDLDLEIESDEALTARSPAVHGPSRH